MSRKLIVGNWKMNGSLAANAQLLEGINDGWSTLPEAKNEVAVAVAPPAVYLSQVQTLLENSPLALATQDVSVAASGAYTGDISAAMLGDFGVNYAIVGHSERRKYQGETDAVVAEKALAALDAGLTPIVCLGETSQERDTGQALDVVTRQLQSVIDRVADKANRLAVAYEPIWAIGTGRTATPEQAQVVHAALRVQLAAAIGEDAAKGVAILYGGSMNAVNAAELLGQADIDGGLIGGAALKAADFLAIISVARQVA